MIHRIRTHLVNLLRKEDGSASVEFVIVFPVFLALMIMSLELSIITLRQTMLERGLDIAVRDIRLGTGGEADHDVIKETICDNALILNDCSSSLKLEMVPTDIRQLALLDDNVDCSDKAAESNPVKEFTAGQQNELMLLRACLKYDPLFPNWQLGRVLERDDSGQLSIISMTAFVQEPA